MSKQWKETPPGPEQKELERMFQNKTIDDSDPPNRVRQLNPMFMAYSARVFAVHFRKTKAKCGLSYADDTYSYEENAAAIPELGYSNKSHAQSSIDFTTNTGIEFKNAPYMTWIYTDHLKKLDFVCVAVPVISGSRDVSFVLSEDGMKLSINYTWPSALYNALELFRDKLNSNRDQMSMDHPKLYAFSSRVLECELTESSMPQGSIVIPLPVKVQREVGTWTKSGIVSNDAKIVLLEFQAYQKKPIIVAADTSISFT